MWTHNIGVSALLWKRIFAIIAVLFVLSFQPLQPSARADIVLTDFQAQMTSSIDPSTGVETIALLVNSGLFGPGGFAGGLAAVGSSPPDDNIWLANPFLSSPPDDNVPAISFLLNPGGEVMGIEPSPFRIFLGNPPDDSRPGVLIGELDFSDVSGSLGSLNLSGVMVLGVNAAGVPTGQVFNVAPFTIVNIPTPSSVFLCVFGLAPLAWGRARWTSRFPSR